MATTPAAPATLLRVQRRFAAPRERVFEAWTEPELLTRWFTPYTGSRPTRRSISASEAPGASG